MPEAKFNLNGITFQDGTTLTSRYTILSAGSRLSFNNTTTPLNWTRITDMGSNAHALRLLGNQNTNVSQPGGNSPFNTVFTTRTIGPAPVDTTVNAVVNPTTLGIAQIPQHTHPAHTGSGNAFPGTPSGSGSVSKPGGNTGNINNHPGTLQAHAHPITVTHSANFTTTMDFNLKYIDVILCQFNTTAGATAIGVPPGASGSSGGPP